MKRYHNLNLDSGVSGYDASPKSITIRFSHGGTYLYNYYLPGRAHVETMKKLARKGKGLATYINQKVQRRYFAKLA